MKRIARRIGVGLLGGTVLLIGVALIVLPGPAILVIPLGLTILALEFDWAKTLLRKFRTMAASFRKKLAPRPR